MNPNPRRVGLVGCGQIGAPVLAALQAGELPGWTPCGVLVRDATRDRGPLFTTDPDAFLATRPDLILDTAGPRALATRGETWLRMADVWTVSAAALADDALRSRLETAARGAGHRLRVLPGAFAGLDGVTTMAMAPGAALELHIELLPGPGDAGLRFGGSVRDAARQFPDDVNVAVAAALAGPGLDATRIEVRHAGPVDQHRLSLRAHSAAGTLAVDVRPDLRRGVHPVACNVIAALRRELAVVWVG